VDGNCFNGLTRRLGSRRGALGVLLGGALTAGGGRVGAAPRTKDKTPKKPKGAGVCPTARPCCNCYDDTGNTACFLVDTQEECALLCGNAAGGQYGYNDPDVIRPGTAAACDGNRCVFVVC